MTLDADPPLGEAELAALEAVLLAEARTGDAYPPYASAWRRTAARESVGDEADEDPSATEPGRCR
jgi:hypothetical protein